MKAAVNAIKFFEALANTGIRGKMEAKFFSGLLKMLKPRAKVIDSNLKLAYPESSEQWRKEIRSKVYENLAWTLTEALALQHDAKQALKWVKKVKNEDIYKSTLDKNKGIIFLTAHFGNWELLGTWYAQKAIQNGFNLHVMYQETHDRDIAEYIFNTRKNGGMMPLDKDLSVQKYAKMLKSGAHIAALNDVAGTGRMIVPFMGHDATNTPGPAVLALLSGVPIVPAFIYRNAPFEHEAEFFEPITIPAKNHEINNEERVKSVILECNKVIEKVIRKRPEQWFWLHKRWRP